MKKSTLIWALALAAAALGCLFAWNRLAAARGSVAVIRIDGAEYRRIDLSRVKESYDLEIDTAYGHNTVHVAPGSICVSRADCPDQTCVKMGELTGGGIPIICMPHRLVIAMEESDVDA